MRLTKGNPLIAATILVVVTAFVVAAAIAINASSGLPFNLSFGGHDYTLSAAFKDANGVSKGANVLIGGSQVGQVTGISIKQDKAVVSMRIGRKYGPLHRGTVAAIRYSTLLAQKYVELTPASGTQPLASGATIPSNETVTPVDFDQFLSSLDARTRQQLQVLVQQAGGGVAGEQTAINALVDHLAGLSEQSPPILNTLQRRDPQLASIITNLNTVASRLARTHQQLGGLVGNTSQVTKTLASNDASLNDLLGHLANVSQDTAQTLKGNQGNLRQTVRYLAPVLAQLTPQFTTAARYLTQGGPTLQAEARQLIPEVASAIAQRDAGGNFIRQFAVINTCYDTLSSKPVNPHKNCLAQITGLSKAGQKASGSKAGSGTKCPAGSQSTASPAATATPSPTTSAGKQASACRNGSGSPQPSPSPSSSQGGLGSILGLLGGG
ncbi:MAG: MCE family protein [Nocardiopsaceae bacterium]|jgi:virulence factor Mce-like protein|nr:MCE family protein [Nocardiopsaceae bacterium]